MKKPICPIGLECLDRYCSNYSACKNWSYSWEIPYRVKDGVLTVKEYGWSYEWHELDQGLGWDVASRCSLPSGHYLALDRSFDTDHGYHDHFVKQQIRQAWLDAGWAAAVALPVDPEPELDEIPF